jgi:hypothetical protein
MKPPKSLTALIPGQLVAIANCREVGIVRERLGPNLYAVMHGTECWTIRRACLSTWIRGAWRPNANAGQLAPCRAI